MRSELATDSQIDQYLSLPRQYVNIDGIGEMGLGFMALSFGILEWLQLSSPMDSIWNQMYTLFVLAGMVSVILRYGTKALKERITFPRTGYVEYRKDSRKRLIAGFTTIVVAMVVSSVALSNRGQYSAAPALVGLLVSLSYLYGFARTVHWKLYVALALAVSAVAISTLPSKVVESWADLSHFSGPFPPAVMGRYAVLTAFFGITLLTSGGVAFWLYLRRTQPQVRDAE